jgi:hypothetical protein
MYLFYVYILVKIENDLRGIEMIAGITRIHYDQDGWNGIFGAAQGRDDIGAAGTAGYADKDDGKKGEKKQAILDLHAVDLSE